MNIINVPPTKTKQLEIKRDLAMASEGYTLLEQKREILVMELMQLVDRCKAVQAEVEERRVAAYDAFKRAMALHGYRQMTELASGIQYNHVIKTDVRISAGIRIPTLTVQSGMFKGQYGFNDSSAEVDEVMAAYLSLLEAEGRMAELETAVWLLAREVKKTQRHVNALDHIFIPEYKETLAFIGQALESKELESFSSMKKVKKNLEKGGE